MDELNPQPVYYPPTPPARRPRRRIGVEILKFLGLFVFFFVLLTLIVMAPTVYTKVSYYFFAPQENFSQKYELPVSVGTDLRDIQEVSNALDQKTTTPSADTLLIPKINVNAPIVYPTESSNEAILNAIKSGVAHYPNTAMPGRVGNVFLTAHSSYYWWSGGEFNQVFALLDKLAVGDLVYVYHQGSKYIYRVNKSFVVSPSQVDILNTNTQPILTLMTCTPVGTSLRRLVVQAELVGRPPVDAGDFAPFQQIPNLPIILPV